MAWIELKEFDMGGVNTDLAPRSLPLSSVTGITNVGFSNGKITKLLGYTTVYGTPTVAPYHLQHIINTEGEPWVIYCGLNDIYSYYANTHTKITRTLSAYAAQSNNDWSSTVLGGIVVVNDGSNLPQFTVSPTDQLANLTNWPASWSCKTIRAYREFLIALDMTEGGSDFPQKLRWSDAAVPGSVPSSWSATDPTKLAGTKYFAETPGVLIDCLPMGSANVVYKSDSAYVMQFVGGAYKFTFNKIFDIGIIGRNCVAEVEGQHVFMSYNDIYIHNGGKPQSLLHKKLRGEIFDSMDSAYRGRSRVVADTSRKQVWFMIPTNGTGWLDTAWIWNWRDNTWGKMELPNLTCVSVGGEVGASQAWDIDTGTWDSDNTFWNNIQNVSAQLLIGSALNTKLYQGNYLYQAEGVNYTSEVERTGIDFGDSNSIKVVRKVRPHFNNMTAGTQVTISVGSQEFSDSTPVWKDMTYTIGSTQEVWPLVRGRYISWKASMSANDAMELESLEFDVVKNGSY